MSKFEGELANFNIIDGGIGNSIPIQYLTKNKKTNDWKKATVDSICNYGNRMLQRNRKFAEYRKMKDGEYTGMATDFIREFQDDFDIFGEDEINRNGAPEWVRHYDFTSIILNAFVSVFQELDDKYRIESVDEYATNEFLRFKNEQIRKNAELLFAEELERMLLLKGVDVNKSDFQSEEDQAKYQEYVDQEVKSLTPDEIEKFVAKGFKVLAVEWAQNKLTADKKDFNFSELDKEQFMDMLLSGRYFRHYKIKFDTYDIERWSPEETYFSAEVDTKLPQKEEFIGRRRYMSISSILNTYGHLMSPKMIKDMTEYWGSEKNYKNYGFGGYSGEYSTTDYKKALIPQPVVTPFHNYFEHKFLEKLEDATGQPSGITTSVDEEGEEHSFRSFVPREEYGYSANRPKGYLRHDLELRRDSIQVDEGYWRSYKQMAILVFENQYGQVELSIVDEDLLKGFLEKNEIKKVNTKSISEIRKAFENQDFSDYINTITYFPQPESWKFVRIKGNGLTVQDDLYLDVAPTDFQIKGTDSNLFDVLLPVSGLISTGVIPHIINEQIGYNIQMNGITELTMSELGVIFALDVTGIPDEYRGESTMEALDSMWDAARATKLMPLDLSRQNTQGNSPNVFQRQDLSFTDMINAKWAYARNYKQEAFGKLGISPEILGAPQAYATAEGVKQGVNGSMALMSPYFDKFNYGKTEGINFHLAFSQFCEYKGIRKSSIYRNSDGDTYYLDIMKEDGELFPLRKLGIVAETDNKDRKIVETIRGVVMNNNTIVNDLDDLITLFTNPVLAELKSAAQDMKKQKEAQGQKDFERQQQLNQQTIDAQSQAIDKDYAHEKELTAMKIQGDIEEKYIDAIGRAADKTSNTDGYDRIEKAFNQSNQDDIQKANLMIKNDDVNRKLTADNNNNSAKLQEIGLKAREIALKERALNVKERIALTPKTVNII